MTQIPDARAAASPPLSALRAGSLIGGYRLVRRLGAGGMGVVWEVADGEGNHVAMKILHPQIAADPTARRRLDREASVLARVRHSSVARILDIETGDSDGGSGVTFVITELVDGPTLQYEVDHEGAYDLTTDIRDLSDLAHGLVEALTEVHTAGVIHRDLKPSNVMLGAQGPVLIDFGIAQVADDVRLTQTGQVTGTPGFIPPEMLDGDDPSPGVDWYACAGVLLFAVTGRAPFGSGPWQAVFRRVYAGTPELGNLEGDSPALARAFAAALAPTSKDRLPIEDLLAVIDEIADGGTGEKALAHALGESLAQEAAVDTGAFNLGYGMLPDPATADSRAAPSPAAQSPASQSPPSSSGRHAAPSAEPAAPSGRHAAPSPNGHEATGGYGAVSSASSSPASSASYGVVGDSKPAASPSAPPPSFPPSGYGSASGEASSGTSILSPVEAAPASIAPGAQPATGAQLVTGAQPVTNGGTGPHQVAPAASMQAFSPAVQSGPQPPTPAMRSAMVPQAAMQPAPMARPQPPVPTPPPMAAPTPAAMPQPMARPAVMPGQPASNLPSWAREPDRHPGVVGAIGAFIAAVSFFAPVWMPIVLAVLTLIVGTVGRADDARRWRRLRMGRISPSDNTRMAAALPWYLLRSLLSTFFAFLLSLVVAVVVFYVATNAQGSTEDISPHGAMRIIVLIIVILEVGVWFAPWAASTRRGGALAIETIMPTKMVRIAVAITLVAVAAVFVLLHLLQLLPVTLSPIPESWYVS